MATVTLQSLSTDLVGHALSYHVNLDADQHGQVAVFESKRHWLEFNGNVIPPGVRFLVAHQVSACFILSLNNTSIIPHSPDTCKRFGQRYHVAKYLTLIVKPYMQKHLPYLHEMPGMYDCRRVSIAVRRRFRTNIDCTRSPTAFNSNGSV